jgi:hypothetical protein
MLHCKHTKRLLVWKAIHHEEYFEAFVKELFLFMKFKLTKSELISYVYSWFFSEKLAILEIMCVKYFTAGQATIWRMTLVCWIPKAVDMLF